VFAADAFAGRAFDWVDRGAARRGAPALGVTEAAFGFVAGAPSRAAWRARFARIRSTLTAKRGESALKVSQRREGIDGSRVAEPFVPRR
jgi:hypothetical protein